MTTVLVDCPCASADLLQALFESAVHPKLTIKRIVLFTTPADPDRALFRMPSHPESLALMGKCSTMQYPAWLPRTDPPSEEDMLVAFLAGYEAGRSKNDPVRMATGMVKQQLGTFAQSMLKSVEGVDMVIVSDGLTGPFQGAWGVINVVRTREEVEELFGTAKLPEAPAARRADSTTSSGLASAAMLMLGGSA